MQLEQMCLNKRKPSKHCRYQNCAYTANNTKLPLRRRTICRSLDTFVHLAGDCKMLVSYNYTPFNSWGTQLLCSVQVGTRESQSVVTFDFYEIEQPCGSSELVCNKNFIKEPGIIAVYCKIAGAPVSPCTENPENPMHCYYKRVTSNTHA